MEFCGDRSEPIKNIFDLDYLYRKSSWCVKNNFVNCDRLCMYVEQITRLSSNSISLDHLFYANDIIEYFAEHYASEPKYVYYLKRMLALCLMPPTMHYITECSDNPRILTRFYDVMAKCISLVHKHSELNILLFGVIQSSVLRRHPVPENSVSLESCYEGIEMSDLPATLMQLVENASHQTFLDDLLKLSYHIAVMSDRSALRMMRSDGIRILVTVLNPTFLSTPLKSFDRLNVCQYAIMLMNIMFSTRRESGDVSELPRITRNTVEILLCNIKMEMEKNVLDCTNMRDDFCYIFSEIVSSCLIDENELSEEIINEIVMLCVWPEVVQPSHWLDNVRFDQKSENFVLKSVMLDIVNRLFLNVSRPEFQHLNTFLIKNGITLLNVDYAKNTYEDKFHPILNRCLLNLPYLLLNSVDNPIRNGCCTQLITLIKWLQSQECFSSTMVNVLICIGIVANDDPDMFRMFKALRADVLINAVMLDALKTNDVNVQDIILYGLNALNVFSRDTQHNPGVQTMVFNVVMRIVKMCLAGDNEVKIDQNVLLDLLRFVKNAIIPYSDQVELFVGAGVVEHLLNALATAKYPIQLAILTTLVDLATYPRARSRISKWKCAKTNAGYLETICEIWRRELVKFDFIDDAFVFREQRDKTTAENLAAGCSPAVESMIACAQPKIYALLRLAGFGGEDHASRGRADAEESEVDARENTVRACGLAARLEDKATVAHAYHYYALKMCDVWRENEVLLRTAHDRPDETPPSPVESQSVDVMTARRAHLTALIRTVRSTVAFL